MITQTQKVHLMFWVEERSMEAFLQSWFNNRFLVEAYTGTITFEGKKDLLANLGAQIKAYQKANVQNLIFRHIVLVDADNDDCVELKKKILKICREAGLSTRGPGNQWEAAVCIVMKELEAWFFGNWDAVRCAYPRVPKDIPRKAAYRNSDNIKGKTSKALERVLQSAKCIKGGLRKIETAELIGPHYIAENSNSPSFNYFHQVLNDAASLGASSTLENS